MSLVVASKLKEAVKSQGMMCAGDLVEGASAALDVMITAACGRAKANGRKTVRKTDL